MYSRCSQGVTKVIYTKYSKQFKWNLYFYGSGQSRAVLGRAKTALKFKYEIWIGQHIYHSMYGAGHKLEKWNENHELNHELFILLHT